ncbi:MAG: DinB family protein [Chloroflexi bacterium]|nr:DinB family protein [Chloroflexota bacterium]
MIQPELLIYLFSINLDVLKRQTEGITHDESLMQLPFRGNCLNWTLGHILVSRDRILQILGEEMVLRPEEAELYASGSDPINESNAHKALRLEQLLAGLEVSQERLTAALKGMTYQDMQQISNERPLGQRLAFFFFHDTYHTGQTEILRQLTGKNDKVI